MRLFSMYMFVLNIFGNKLDGDFFSFACKNIHVGFEQAFTDKLLFD